jgi:hypothetical protein
MASPAYRGRWIREEAAMAAIAINAVRQAEHGREQVNTVLAVQFQPLDPAVVSEAIPAFFIGRNEEGFWIARDVKGRIGGIFLRENSALSFARRNSGPGDARPYFPPTGSNSIWKTTVTRWPPSLDR